MSVLEKNSIKKKLNQNHCNFNSPIVVCKYFESKLGKYSDVNNRKTYDSRTYVF